MRQFLISKYDKNKRNEDGVYLECDQWTESDDIGRTIAGKKLRVGEYLKTEAKYIDAVVRHFQISGLDHLRLTSAHPIEWQLASLRKRRPELHELSFFDVDFTEDALITADLIPTYIKMILRNLGQAKLEFAGRFFVHFGWDFYMYLGTVSECENVNQEIERNGLFVIGRESPYRPRAGASWPICLERSGVMDDVYDDEFKEVFECKTLDSLKKGWNYSKEHPFHGTWEVSEAQLEAMSKYTDHVFDFENYHYWLNTDDQDYWYSL